jgi:hypothetical protein
VNGVKVALKRIAEDCNKIAAHAESGARKSRR